MGKSKKKIPNPDNLKFRSQNLQYADKILTILCLNHHMTLDKFIIFTSSKQSFIESLDFATIHSLMNTKNLIDSCQAHLSVQYASNIKTHSPEVILVL